MSDVRRYEVGRGRCSEGARKVLGRCSEGASEGVLRGCSEGVIRGCSEGVLWGCSRGSPADGAARARAHDGKE